MLPWPADEFRALRLEEIDERYRRYRVTALEAEEAMARSLRRYGQISPLVVCLREEAPVLVDGFKRLAAARGLKGFETLSAKRIDADERAAKAAMYGLNRTGRHFGELEEAWLVQALVREDGLSQVEVASINSSERPARRGFPNRARRVAAWSIPTKKCSATTWPGIRTSAPFG